MSGSGMVLRHRNVALVATSNVVSALGSGAMFVGLPYYTYTSTGSVLATAAVTMAECAPTVGVAQLAGVLVDRWDPRRVLIGTNLALAVCTLAYLVEQEWWWLAPFRPVTPTSGLLKNWKDGLKAVGGHPVLRSLVTVMVLVGIGEGFVSALLAPWMADIAGGDSTELGLMLSLQAVGGIVGGVLVLRWAHRWSSLTFLHTGALLSGALLVVIINYPLVAPVGPWPAILLTALAGLPFAVYGTAQSIAVQEHSADGLRARIASLTFGAQGIAQLIGIGIAGPLGQLLGPLTINAEALSYFAAGAFALKAARRQATAP